MDQKQDYKESLNLPKTTFPMRANLAQKEIAQLADWEQEGLQAKILSEHADDQKYILHDGPPYANGHLHIGHALNKILKDIIIKARTMMGYNAPYVPGWDCHGLPIEHQVLKKLGSKKKGMSKLEIRQRCRDYANRFVEIQKAEFKRLGVFGDWEHPYLTMTPDYEAAIVRELGKVLATGAVYKGKKPVFWCSFDETALAEAEVEHAEHISPSIYVKFQVTDSKGKLCTDSEQETFFVIWTTTPWTLVANKAIALHPALCYRRVKTPKGCLIVAEALVEQSMKDFGFDPASYEILAETFTGNDLEGIICRHPWLAQSSPVILGDHVTLEQGTGCVHTAPGHGQEDYEVGLKYQLEVYAPVDNRGRFTEAAGPFSGEKVFDANPKIITLLKEQGALLNAREIAHSYPHCWRCKRPVIFRATEQWFISMSKNSLRKKAIEAIESEVEWIPKWGKERILGMIQNRPDWCISRQRVWGVPIVAFACLDCQASLLTEAIANHVADQIETEGGSDIWFSKSAEALLPEGTACKKCGGQRFQQEGDILDVWFESGVSHAAVMKRRPELTWPADLYLEGSDQHRGWFHSSMLVSLMTDKKVPYRAVLTHGFVVDGSGKKMSKSDGNVVAPQEIIKHHGADILRLWVAATDFREDIRISSDILVQMVEAYRKIRNTCRFLLSNLSDYHPGEQSLSAKEPSASRGYFLEIDLWALDRLQVLNEKVQRAYRDASFHVVFHALNNFCAVELSAFYLDILKDRLYTSGKNAPRRRAAQYVLLETLLTLTRLMAPILSFTAEEIWRHLPENLKTASSVHLCRFPMPKAVDEARIKKWEKLIQVREAVARVLETARKEGKIGNSLQAAVRLSAKAPVFELLKKDEAFLPTLFIVSQVSLFPSKDAERWGDPEGAWRFTEVLEAEGLSIEVSAASGRKCKRCWMYQEDVASDPNHPSLCGRCAEVLAV